MIQHKFSGLLYWALQSDISGVISQEDRIKALSVISGTHPQIAAKFFRDFLLDPQTNTSTEDFITALSQVSYYESAPEVFFELLDTRRERLSPEVISQLLSRIISETIPERILENPEYCEILFRKAHNFPKDYN